MTAWEKFLSWATFGWYGDKLAAEEQHRRDLDSLINNQNATMNELFDSIDSAETLISQYEKELSTTLPFNISEYREWLANYEGMLNGEENELSLYRDALRGDLSAAENAMAEFSLSSPEQIRQLMDQGYGTLSSYRQQQALANVQAGASGSVKSAYTSLVTKNQADIIRYAGNDMRINEDTGEVETGAFARQLIILKTALDTQKTELEASLTAAKYALTKWTEDIEDQKTQTEIDLESSLERIDFLKEEIEKEKQNIKDASSSAIAVLSQFLSTSSERGWSSDSKISQLRKWRDKFKQLDTDVFGTTAENAPEQYNYFNQLANRGGRFDFALYAGLAEYYRVLAEGLGG